MGRVLTLTPGEAPGGGREGLTKSAIGCSRLPIAWYRRMDGVGCTVRTVTPGVARLPSDQPTQEPTLDRLTVPYGYSSYVGKNLVWAMRSSADRSPPGFRTYVRSANRLGLGLAHFDRLAIGPIPIHIEPGP